MRIFIFSLSLMIALTGVIFPEDILPELRDYIEAMLPEDSKLLSVTNCSQETVNRLLELRLGQNDLIVTERFIESSENPINTSDIEEEKIRSLIYLSSMVNSYNDIKDSSFIYDENTDSFIMNISSTIKISADTYFYTLRNHKEELRFVFEYLTADGSTRYGAILWISVEERYDDNSDASFIKFLK